MNQMYSQLDATKTELDQEKTRNKELANQIYQLQEEMEKAHEALYTTGQTLDDTTVEVCVGSGWVRKLSPTENIKWQTPSRPKCILLFVSITMATADMATFTLQCMLHAVTMVTMYITISLSYHIVNSTLLRSISQSYLTVNFSSVEALQPCNVWCCETGLG